MKNSFFIYRLQPNTIASAIMRSINKKLRPKRNTVIDASVEEYVERQRRPRRLRQAANGDNN